MIEPNSDGTALRQTFDDTAHWYDAIYAARGKDYAAEAGAVLERLEERGVHGGRLADVGCGTGEHSRYLSERFEIFGFDPSRAMLEVARRKLPHAHWIRATAEAFPCVESSSRAESTPRAGVFDAITMMFSAIGYLPSLDAARSAVQRFARALRPGGVIIIEPALFRGEVDAPQEQRDRFHVGGRDIDRRTTAVLREDRLDIRFEYSSGGARRVEEHPVQLWSRREYSTLFEGTGTSLSIVPTEPFGRPLLIARPARDG